MDEGDAPFVDVVFELAGKDVPAEYAWPLWRALAARLPWLEDVGGAGVHPLRVAPTGYGIALLARRARLGLRLPRERVPAALALEGATLDVAGSLLVVGAGTQRPLWPWGTLYARQVVTGSADALSFEQDAARTLTAMGIGCQSISGRRHTLLAGDREIVAFALALNNVERGDSLRLQCEGMGSERALGCGLFVPHKSMAAVG